MSISSIKEMIDKHIEQTGTRPAVLKVGRAVLDALADEIPQNSFFRHAPELPIAELSPDEWREHIAGLAILGKLFMFGIRVELCE